MEPQFFDTHCHLDLMLGPIRSQRSRRRWVWGSLTAGSTHATFRPQTSAPVANQASSPALGFTPGGLADGRCGPAEVNLLCEFAAQERYIGEVGLDFSACFAGSEPLQIQALDRLCDALVQHPLVGRVISIHAVRSAGAVLDVLESHGLLIPNSDSPAIIFHWFSGTSDELARARNAGCNFSVNERMLASKRGREYARQIPLDRLLLETDAPAEPNTETSAQSLIRSLTRASGRIASLKNCDAKHIESAVLANARSVFDLR